MRSEDRFDVVVLGGGLLGCFTARHLTRYALRVALLEAREDVCTGISRANTAIVYPGVDTRPGTLKTRLCVEACQSFDQLCQQLGVPFRRRGSLMVSYGPNADRVLKKKFAQGQENGVPGLELLTGAQAAAREPNLAPGISSALYAPGTGTVIPWALGIAAFENARANGCTPLLNHRVTAITPEERGYRLSTTRGEFVASAVINCCGLFADEVQEMVAEPSVRILPDRADYLVLDEAVGDFVHHVVFYEPEEKGKGLTLVPTVEGTLLLGPSEQPGEGDKHSFATTSAGLAFLRDQAARVVPDLDLTNTIRSFGGLRPNPFYVRREGADWVTEDRSIHSFTIQSPAPNFWSFLGIKTPGLTCADGLGALAARQAAEALGKAENPAFDPLRPPPIRVNELSLPERAALVAEQPAYGRVLCRCGGITEGEVLDAIARGAVTLDGVKRRAGTGLGRCQGSYCAHRVMELLARETGVSLRELTRDGPGTTWLGGDAP